MQNIFQQNVLVDIKKNSDLLSKAGKTCIIKPIAIEQFSSRLHGQFNVKKAVSSRNDPALTSGSFKAGFVACCLTWSVLFWNHIFNRWTSWNANNKKDIRNDLIKLYPWKFMLAAKQERCGKLCMNNSGNPPRGCWVTYKYQSKS